LLPRTDRRTPPFDAVLKRGLERQRAPGGMHCPDDAILAAYCERSLAASENARWEGHFSNCARCQEILAAMARARTTVGVAPQRAQWRWQAYAAIAAGLAGVSIAVGLMVAGRHQGAPADLSLRNQLAATEQFAYKAPSAIAPASPQIALNEPPPPSQPETGARSEQEDVIAGHKLRAPMAGLGAFSLSGPPASRASRPAPSRNEPAQKLVPEAEPAPFGMPAPPPLAMKRRGVASFAANASAPAPASEAATGASAAPGSGMATGNGGAAMISITTADGVERWRLGAGGTIQHLGADGEWNRQKSGFGNDLTAGAAPSPDVCWAVGTGGIVLRTADGQHWHRLTSPTAENLVAVSAVNASSAVITTADRRRFATADGGRTWSPL
jgi:hypothetical protein